MSEREKIRKLARKTTSRGRLNDEQDLDLPRPRTDEYYCFPSENCCCPALRKKVGTYVNHRFLAFYSCLFACLVADCAFLECPEAVA